MKELAGSRRVKRSLFRQALETCTEVKEVAMKLANLVQKSPSSSDVVIQASRITASSGLKCTFDEKAALFEIDDDFEKALTTIHSALRAVQEQLVTLTGVARCPDGATGNKIRNNI